MTIEVILTRELLMLGYSCVQFSKNTVLSQIFGGHKAVARPVPIPNTAVKHSLADGSGFIDSARVGCRQFFILSRSNDFGSFFVRDAISAGPGTSNLRYRRRRRNGSRRYRSRSGRAGWDERVPQVLGLLNAGRALCCRRWTWRKLAQCGHIGGLAAATEWSPILLGRLGQHAPSAGAADASSEQVRIVSDAAPLHDEGL